MRAAGGDGGAQPEPWEAGGRRCGYCQQPRHNRRSCPTRQADETRGIFAASEDDAAQHEAPAAGAQPVYTEARLAADRRQAERGGRAAPEEAAIISAFYQRWDCECDSCHRVTYADPCSTRPLTVRPDLICSELDLGLRRASPTKKNTTEFLPSLRRKMRQACCTIPSINPFGSAKRARSGWQRAKCRSCRTPTRWRWMQYHWSSRV